MEISQRELQEYMTKCIELAKKVPDKVGKPYVGVLVISNSGKIVGEGYKTLLEGTDYLIHAERKALGQAESHAKGGCLVTTLEPCVMVTRRQVFKSCSELIVETGIQLVVVGLLDNSPSVNRGSGIGYLVEQGVQVQRYEDLNSIIISELMQRKYSQSFFKQSDKR